MTKVSNEAFLKILQDGTRSNGKKALYLAIKRNPGISTAQLQWSATGMGESTVTARISDLLDMGLIKIVGDFESKVSKHSTYLIVKDFDEQIALSKARTKEKAMRYVKALEKLGVPFYCDLKQLTA